MANLKEIRNRIHSVKKTQKTTSAMKMVSAAKLKRAQDTIEAAYPYSQKLKAAISALSASMTEEDHSLFAKPQGNRVVVVVITSDRGLCGGFNTNLCKRVSNELRSMSDAQIELVTIGRKGGEYFKRTNYSVSKKYANVAASDQEKVIKEVIDDLQGRFIRKEIDRVFLAYNHFISVLAQEPQFHPLFPITPPEMEASDDRELIFEPSRDEILDSILQQYVNNQFLVGWLDSAAGEHGARMNAMENATKNAGEMIDKLQLYYNRTRQAAITKELIEIVSGAESL